MHKVKYMARFIPLVSQVLYSLQQVAKHDPLVWNEECKAVFQNAKEILGGLPAMQAPDWAASFLCESISWRRYLWCHAFTKREREPIYEASILCK